MRGENGPKVCLALTCPEDRCARDAASGTISFNTELCKTLEQLHQLLILTGILPAIIFHQDTLLPQATVERAVSFTDAASKRLQLVLSQCPGQTWKVLEVYT